MKEDMEAGVEKGTDKDKYDRERPRIKPKEGEDGERGRGNRRGGRFKRFKTGNDDIDKENQQGLIDPWADIGDKKDDPWNTAEDSGWNGIATTQEDKWGDNVDDANVGEKRCWGDAIGIKESNSSEILKDNNNWG